MRITSLVFIALVFASKAYGANWETLLEFPELIAEIDAESITKTNPDEFEAVFRFTHPTQQKNADSGALYRSAEVTSRFDCKRKMYAPYHRVEFSSVKGEGVKTGSVDVPKDKLHFSSLLSGSMNEIMYNRVCENYEKPMNER